jgi:hypothetical protein
MKIRLALAMLFVGLAGCGKSEPKEPKRVTVLWMDDIAYPTSGTEFANAFALEPACNGLSFYHWNDSSDKDRIRLVNGAPHWEIFFNGSDGVGRNMGIKAIRITPTGFHGGAEVSVEVGSAEEAAKKACFVAKRTQGKFN